jgi:hypothetical protein
MARSPRQEFPAPVVREIDKRSIDEKGVRRCEVPSCRHPIKIGKERTEGARAAQLDHKRACWTQKATDVADRPPLTANDGWMICEVCHKAKTRREAFERMRTDGGGKQHAEHLEIMEAKLMGIELEPKRGKLKGRGFPKASRKLQGRGFSTKAERQAFRAGD